MTTLITGGAGFIGSYLARLLIDSGEQPVIFDIAPVQGPLQELKDSFLFEQGSLSHLSVLMDCIEKHNVGRIFHLGGMLSLPSENNHCAAFDANVVGAYNVLEAARIKKIPQVLYGSTIATYSKDILSDEIDDRTLQRPSSFYGVSKTFGELLGRFYHRKFGLDFRGLRLPSIVGPGARTAHMSIFNAWAIEYPLKGLPYVLECEPESRCAALYFKDAARLLLDLSAAAPEKIQTRVYNVAGITPPYSARRLVEIVEERVPGARLSFQPNPVVVDLLRELATLRINDERARSEWGLKINYPLEEMVEDFILEFGNYHNDNKEKNEEE
ncbi:MAG: NAD-dependent epimerase/dehydratase family protein [Deltaproteobacteria bacterium]|nr:NAD-dependent epimerase/dehydratase family protein [Deltaproteobacteria bacterium]